MTNPSPSPGPAEIQRNKDHREYLAGYGAGKTRNIYDRDEWLRYSEAFRRGYRAAELDLAYNLEHGMTE